MMAEGGGEMSPGSERPAAAAAALTIEPASREDAGSIHALLREARLPVEGIPEGLDGFLLAFTGGSPVGVVGLVRYGSAGLLRSLAVEPGCRRHGVGRALCERLIEEARAAGVRDLYLLTEGAAEYFERLGFVRVGRDSAPDAIVKSREFGYLCPETADLMVRKLSTRDAPPWPAPPAPLGRGAGKEMRLDVET